MDVHEASNVNVCVRVYVCVTDEFHHCRERKEEQQHEYNKDEKENEREKRRRRRRTTSKSGNTKRTKKYVHQPNGERERAREKSV